MDIPGVSLRAAEVADAAAIAAFHHEIWTDTYRDIAPREAHAMLTRAYREQSWAAGLARPEPGRLTLVARQGDAVVGLMDCTPKAEVIFAGRGEVRHLYVGHAARGLGLGRRFLAEAAHALARHRVAGLGLAVVADNHASRAFYKACEGREAGAFTDPGPVWRSRNILVVWDDLGGLA